jgi:large subunit ribosomal protein L13
MLVYDAEKHVVGRLCTTVAKKLLQGEEVVIVNAEKAIVTGDRYQVFEHYEQKRNRGYTHSGPFYPRRADLIIKRSVRGMLPWDMSGGKAAYHRLKVYVGVPKEFVNAEKLKVEKAMEIRTSKYVTVSEIAAFLGSKVK